MIFLLALPFLYLYILYICIYAYISFFVFACFERVDRREEFNYFLAEAASLSVSCLVSFLRVSVVAAAAAGACLSPCCLCLSPQ